MSIITGEELKEKLDQGEDIVIIDLREEEDYKKGHIKGCLLYTSSCKTNF